MYWKKGEILWRTSHIDQWEKHEEVFAPVPTTPFSFSPDISFIPTIITFCINLLPCGGHKRLIIQMTGITPAHLGPCCFHNSFVNSKSMLRIGLALLQNRHFNGKWMSLANILVSKMKEIFGVPEYVCLWKLD